MNKVTSVETLAVLNDLKALGFSEYEARVYIALIGESPATAYEVSNRSGVPRPNTYSILKALSERRAVMPVSTNPVRYVPQPADQLFKSIAEQTQELCQTVSDSLAKLTFTTGEQYVWNLSGDKEVHGKVSEMITGAEIAIWFKAEPDLLRLHREELRAAAVERGVRLMIILYGTDPGEFQYNDRCEVYVHEGTGFPMGFADNNFTIAVDHREMLTARVDDGLTAAHTQSNAIVIMALSLLRHDYYMAEIFRVLRPQIDDEFGPHLRKLRQHSYTPEQYASFEEKTGQLPPGRSDRR